MSVDQLAIAEIAASTDRTIDDSISWLPSWIRLLGFGLVFGF
jgi:hypothetical protein